MNRSKCLPAGFFFFICLAFSTVHAYSGSFSLKINDVSGLDGPWPLVASLAFPEGELKDPSAIRITGSGREVPCQVDVAATWRDGSIRWALAGFTDSPRAEYMVEYGSGVRRCAYSKPLKVTLQPDGGFTVDTGEAIYSFDRDNLLFGQAWLVTGGGRTSVLEGSGSGAYMVDNSGRTARISGRSAEVKNEVLKEGPGRFVVKRSGWYVTEEGEKLARGEAWFYFAAGTPYVRITHSIIFTEDTNKIWIKDYGLEFRTPATPGNTYFAAGAPGQETIKSVETQGRDVFMMQDTYPHFAERESRAAVGRTGRAPEEFPVAGDWGHGDYGSHGITLVMPWLAERFPKEISFGPSGAKAVFWSGRCVRELDFRTKTLVKDYWKSWAEIGPLSPGTEKLETIPSNAQGAARTHDVWFLPHTGPYNEPLVRKAAHAASRIPLAMADPQWMCATEAIGFPLRHQDPAMFPKEEALISEAWEQLMVPYKVFPMTGFINWGHNCYLRYQKRQGKWLAEFLSYGNMNAYNLQRNAWNLFVRSGERRYYEYTHKYGRLLGDFGIVRWDAPEKPRGAFTRQNAPVSRMPHYWGNGSRFFGMGNSSSDIGHWLLEYYLTGDEASRELTVLVGESIKKNWNLEDALNWRTTISILLLRKLSVLYMREWDEDFHRLAKELADSLFLAENPVGLNPAYMSYNSSTYKDERHILDLYFYYKTTGDERGKDTLLKIVDHRYRFNRSPNAISYQNSTAFAYTAAYWMTGNKNYRPVVEETLKDGMDSMPPPLSEQLKEMPADPYEWRSLPSRFLIPANIHPFVGIPVAMKMIEKEGWLNRPFPVLVKSSVMTPADALFHHEKGKDTVINLFFRSSSGRDGLSLKVLQYNPYEEESEPVKGVSIEVSGGGGKNMVETLLDRTTTPYSSYHAKITVPGETETGLYRLSLGGADIFTVLDATTDKVSLYCPEGFWSMTMTSGLRGQRLGEENLFFFRVPDGLKNLEIFLGRPQKIKGPDGQVILESSEENTGRVSIPVNGRSGIWSIEATQVSFTKLLNIEPVVAFRSPGRLPEEVTGRPLKKQVLTARTAPLEFVEGKEGKAVRLTVEKTLSFSRGRELEDGSYSFFPGLTGTVEFWYKPDWSSQDIVLGRGNSFRVRSLLTGPHMHLGYRYGGGPGKSFLYSDLIMELLCSLPGAEKPAPHLNAKSQIGREEEHLFKAGEWNHLAFTWAFEDVKKSIADMPPPAGDIKMPLRWRVFGPVDGEAPVLPAEVLKSYPEQIEFDDQSVEGRDFVVRETFYEFPRVLRLEPPGSAAYVFLQLNSKTDQEVTFGMGADGIMEAWVNGTPVLDSSLSSDIQSPVSIWNHTVNVQLVKGDNILAVRYVRGRTPLLALGGPAQLKSPVPSLLKWEFSIFANGKRMEYHRDRWMNRFLRIPSGKEVVTLLKEGKNIVIGPLDGAVDILRISDIVRYKDDFKPPLKDFEMDENTRALFLFDGSLKGVSSFSGEPLDAR